MKRILAALTLASLLAVLLPASASATSPYSFTATSAGQPIHWNGCRIIHWRFNPAHAPLGGLLVTRQAVHRIATTTGTTWVYDGTSTATPTGSYLPTTVVRKPVLIGWTDAAHSSLLAHSPSSVAKTEIVWVHGRIFSAAVALNRAAHLPLIGGGSWRTTELHELGHVMGLAHSHSSKELMYDKLNRALVTLQPGDVAGLQRVGRKAGC